MCFRDEQIKASSSSVSLATRGLAARGRAGSGFFTRCCLEAVLVLPVAQVKLSLAALDALLLEAVERLTTPALDVLLDAVLISPASTLPVFKAKLLLSPASGARGGAATGE